MLHILILKVTKFQLPLLTRLSKVVKNIFSGGEGGHDAPMSNRVTPRNYFAFLLSLKLIRYGFEFFIDIPVQLMLSGGLRIKSFQKDIQKVPHYAHHISLMQKLSDTFILNLAADLATLKMMKAKYS